MVNQIKLISWNLNGIRAVIKKGLWGKMREMGADIYCFQETKAKAEQVGQTLDMPQDFYSYYNSAEKAGYSGVATFTKMEPRVVINGTDNEEFVDNEGRILVTKFDEFTLLNVYFPNGKKDKARLFFKMDFYDHFLRYINTLRERGEKIIFCGDVNTAHEEIDLARPKENVKVSGFLDIERQWLDKLAKNGYVDTFRIFNPQNPGFYTWWDQKSGARERNVGWRIDYVFVSEELRDQVKNAFILKEMTGSDHCPVGIEIVI
jgi:exodeoxyribonuclease-3